MNFSLFYSVWFLCGLLWALIVYFFYNSKYNSKGRLSFSNNAFMIALCFAVFLGPILPGLAVAKFVEILAQDVRNFWRKQYSFRFHFLFKQGRYDEAEKVLDEWEKHLQRESQNIG
jgi:pentatricopeptide repeat protein